MAFLGFGKKANQTFKPVKAPTGKDGSGALSLKKYAEATLGSGNLKLAVQLPEGEDVNEWLAVHTVDFFNQINMLYGCLTEFCTQAKCPMMSAGSKFEYHWADGVKVKRAIAVSAPEYVDFLMAWVQEQLDDESLFPTKPGAPFSKNFRGTVQTVFKRLFRVFAHMYHSHFAQVVTLEIATHLNTCFKVRNERAVGRSFAVSFSYPSSLSVHPQHFIYFINEFQLVEKKELEPLAELIKTLCP